MSAGCADLSKSDSLTASDTSYLEGLCAMYPDEIGPLQRSAIANAMRLDGAAR